MLQYCEGVGSSEDSSAERDKEFADLCRTGAVSKSREHQLTTQLQVHSCCTNAASLGHQEAGKQVPRGWNICNSIHHVSVRYANTISEVTAQLHKHSLVPLLFVFSHNFGGVIGYWYFESTSFFRDCYGRMSATAMRAPRAEEKPPSRRDGLL